MIGFIKNRIYETKILMRTEELCLRILGKDDGGYAMDIFTMAMKKLKHLGNLSTLMSLYRRSGQSIDESALCLLDGAVTQIKQVVREKQLSADITESLNKGTDFLEKVIDRIMYESPGKFLPRNGHFAQAAKQTGLDKFFTN